MGKKEWFYVHKIIGDFSQRFLVSALGWLHDLDGHFDFLLWISRRHVVAFVHSAKRAKANYFFHDKLLLSDQIQTIFVDIFCAVIGLIVVLLYFEEHLLVSYFGQILLLFHSIKRIGQQNAYADYKRKQCDRPKQAYHGEIGSSEKNLYNKSKHRSSERDTI